MNYVSEYSWVFVEKKKAKNKKQKIKNKWCLYMYLVCVCVCDLFCDGICDFCVLYYVFCSFVPELRAFMVSDDYKQDLNANNPLGQGGRMGMENIFF